MEIRKNNLSFKNEKSRLFFLWASFFVYSIAMALFFQHVLVPNFLSQNGGQLLPNDAVYFDTVAWEMAQKIRAEGWGAWQLFVANGATGNAGVLAAVYAVFGHEPSTIVPINAAMHALGGLLLFIIVSKLSSDNKVGLYAGIITGTLFITFPSSLTWYGQLHKDSYAIVGTFLILIVWIDLIAKPLTVQQSVKILLMTSISTFLIGMVRPYGLTLLLAVSSGAALIALISVAKRYQGKEIFKQAITITSVLVILVAGVKTASDVATKVERKLDSEAKELIDKSTLKTWKWKQSDWIPVSIEKYIAGAASTRFSIIKHDHQVEATSTVDGEIAPESASEVLAYLPRALQIGLLAPFPTMWLESNNIGKLLSVAEMAIYYICIIGFLFLFKSHKTPEVFVSLYFALAFLTILGFTMANLGTLYRVRYAYLFIIVALGIIGWVSWFAKKAQMKRFFYPEARLHQDSSNQVSERDKNTNKNGYQNRNHALKSAGYVMVLTLLGFLGFFYRDILMANIFGLTGELDNFFVALSIPMTLVTILCIPLGTAFTPVFLHVLNNQNYTETAKVVSKLSTITSLILLVICIVLFIFVPSILAMISKVQVAELEQYTTLLLLLLLFSGPIIIGNAVLNALGKAAITATVQLAVPIIAILSILIFGERVGVQAVIWGMIFGQIINLIFVEIYLNRHGYSLKPSLRALAYQFQKKSLKKQYLPLLSSAFFISTSIQVSVFLAMTLPDGSVSTFSLGNKIIVLITGVLGAAVSAVFLPYFSSLITQQQWQKAKEELSGFLVLTTFLSTTFSVVLFLFIESLTELIFTGLSSDELHGIISVLKYAVVQIPFYACNIVLLKFATAVDKSIKVLLTAILGLIVNVILSLFLMERMGVDGIMLGASLAMIVSTFILLLTLMVDKHIKLSNATLLTQWWLLFSMMLIMIVVDNLAGIVSILMAAIISIFSYLLYSRNGHLTEKK